MGEPNKGDSQTQILDEEMLERREWERLLANWDCEVTIATDSGESQKAVVKDVSIAGIAIVVERASRCIVGQSVGIGIGDRTVSAIVKHVAPTPDGSYRIGIFWAEPKIDSILWLMKESQARKCVVEIDASHSLHH